jgi:hypothetical protein
MSCLIFSLLSEHVDQGNLAPVFSIARVKLGYTSMRIRRGCSRTSV